MTSISPNPEAGDDDPSRSDTPLASQSSVNLTTSSDSADPSPPAIQTSESEPSSSPPPTDSPLNTPLLPIPTLLTNTSQASFTLSDVIDDTGSLDPLAPELASADISVAPDGSFVEMSSGPAARELKRYWDQHIGVGKSVRSPYAITAFVNQHGKTMFRVGRRELSAPAANAAEIEERITSSTSPSETSNSPRAKRRSRMSMHAFPSMFKNGSTPSGSRTHASVSQASGPRKLRKTRSIPDMASLTNDGSPPQNVGSGSSTGRAHSRSVTGADISPFSTVVRTEPPAGDLFAEVMDWIDPTMTPSASSSLSRHEPNEPYDHFKSPAIITYPFGHGVMFDSPSRKTSGGPFLPMPRLLREMQSFESGLTARQFDPPKRSGKEPSVVSESTSESNTADPDAGRPLSALRIHPSSSSVRKVELTPTSPSPEPRFAPSPETALLSRYSTDVFDVLQTYRGLPMLEKLSLESEETTVIKLSLSADESAAPRDDPRFVIWGEIPVDRDHDDRSVSHESLTDLSVLSSSLSRRRSSKAKVPEAPSARSSQEDETQKVLIAATIERWIAQLTSDLNYDELLDFFLTYRTYVSAVDLCHLLICRFHWALQQSTSSHDERVRRIVRVRTFVAIRYWLLTFFTVDFLPNRELRLLVANWLNTLIRDPILKKHNDGLGIVRKLIKVAKECKQAHTRPTASKSKPRPSSGPAKPIPAKKHHVLGEKFAAATRKPTAEEDDSDVDLEFLEDDGGPPDIPQGFPHDPANAHLSAAHVGAGLSPARPSSIPFSSFSILQRTDHAPGPGPEPEIPFVPTAVTLPMHHNAISRAFVKTIGRLGRWKRVLNSRATTRTSMAACTNVSAFDLELSVSRDLLTVNGGVEQYLSMATPLSSSLSSAVPALPLITPLPAEESRNSPDVPESPVKAEEFVLPDDVSSTDISVSEPTVQEAPAPLLETSESGSEPEPEVVDGPVDPALHDVDDDDRAVSFRSSSTDSLGAPLTSGGPPPSFPALVRLQRQFDVASIDGMSDLSDSSSDIHEAGPAAPPGLRRPPRKLPLRRDFEFVRRSDSVSSMGLTSRDSMASNTSSVHSFAGFGGNVAPWQINALLDSLSNDEETGDVEDALRRLEGQINPQKRQEKASKVNGWVRTMQERMAAGDYHNEEPMFSDEEYEDYDPSNDQGSDSFDEQDSASGYRVVSAPSISEPEDHDTTANENEMEMVKTPVPTQTAHVIPQVPALGSPTRTTDAKPEPDVAVPLEILQSRILDPPVSLAASHSHRPSFSRFATNPEAPSVHRSFILNYRAAVLAEHFAMIDRELFMGVKFEELVLDDWMGCKEVDVLDWAQYLKDRTRWKAESRFPEKTSALAAVRARFNLIANFTISEIVLTPPNERPVLVSKFIRIAWKAYRMFNLGTLVAIIAGLRSDWVTKAMRRPGWGRVGIWENRMFKDLKLFTANTDDFKHIRHTVESIVDAKPLDANSHAASVVSGGADGPSGKGKATSDWPVLPSVCIPFIGVYLSQLQRHSRLPDLIDPTAPDEAVGINPITSNFDAPAHPEVFSALAPLPHSMHLEPLINVHKQRRIAGVIKALVAGQHLASRVQFDVDKRLFQKCLRLRGLNSDTLQRALAMYPE